jgi:hypothetical protein
MGCRALYCNGNGECFKEVETRRLIYPTEYRDGYHQYLHGWLFESRLTTVYYLMLNNKP